jgi:hypothetical protein
MGVCLWGLLPIVGGTGGLLLTAASITLILILISPTSLLLVLISSELHSTQRNNMLIFGVLRMHEDTT